MTSSDMIHPDAIAFDFDGTLVRGGWDKGVHILIAAYTACREGGLADLVSPENLERDLDRMARAYMNYMGSPRFQQLAALVNALLTDRPWAVDGPAHLGLDETHRRAYETVRERYNALYTALNDAAAWLYWRPYPSAKETLARLAPDFDLYMASGVLQELLEADLDRHGFDRRLFVGILGSSRAGGMDKGEILVHIRGKGYREVVFCGDSNKDCTYARAAGVRFFRIRNDASFGELLDRARRREWPETPEPWEEGPELAAFLREKALRPLQALIAGRPMTPEAISRWINEGG